MALPPGSASEARPALPAPMRPVRALPSGLPHWRRGDVAMPDIPAQAGIHGDDAGFPPARE